MGKLHRTGKKAATILVVMILFGFLFASPAAASEIQNGEFYGKQLTSTVSKQVYQQLVTKGLSGKNIITCFLTRPADDENKEIYSGIIAYFYDYPEQYWVDDISRIRILSGLAVEVKFNRYQQKNDKDDAYISSVLSSVVTQSSSRPNHYERLKSAHDLIAKHISYGNSTGMRGHHLTGAFTDGYGTCEAYAKAFKVVAEEMGYQTVVVAGIGQYFSGGEIEQVPHMWNYVKIEGEWYGVDITWNDAEYLVHDYFLVGADTTSATFGGLRFAETHLEQPLAKNVSLEYPSLSSTGYKSE